MPSTIFERPSKCLVCYRPAVNYHYGVASCKGCKTFFRRMCVGKMKEMCDFNKECFDSKKAHLNIRCQPCRFKKCIEVGMDQNALESKVSLNNKLISKEILVSKFIQSLTHLESKIEIFRMSAYNPNHFELGSLKDLIKCESRISFAERFGPMPGWPQTNERIPHEDIYLKSKMRDVPDNHPKFLPNKKLWMLFNTFATVEYLKTFPFFHLLHQKDQLVLAGHVTLICMYFHMSYFAVSRKVDGCLQPDGTESPQKDEIHFSMTSMAIAPMIRCDIKQEEYVLLKAICLCNPTIHGLSENAQVILTRERQDYSKILFDYCMRTRNNGPTRYAELLGIIPVLEQQQQIIKHFFIFRLAPIILKYDKIALFLNDIMFS